MGLSFSEWTYIVFTVIYVITVFSIIAVVISENRNPVKSLGWITVLLFLPVVGMVLYAFFGRSMKSKRLISNKNKRKLNRIEPFRIIDESKLPLSNECKQEIRLARSLTGARYFPGNEVDIFTNCSEMFTQLKKDITEAKSYIHMQFYIFEDDELGHEISELLIKKAGEGVKVRVIYDHVGSFKAKDSFFENILIFGICAFGYLQVQVFGIYAVFFNKIQKCIDKCRSVKIYPRDVYRDISKRFTIVYPFSYIAADGIPHIVIHLNYKTVVLENGHKISGRYKAFYRVYPSDKGFRSHKFFILKAILRLIEHGKLSVFQRLVHVIENFLLNFHSAAHFVIVIHK